MKINRKKTSLAFSQTGIFQKNNQIAKPRPKMMDLKKIMEVTQQNDHNPIPHPIQKLPKESDQQIFQNCSKKSCLYRYVRCINKLWKMFTTKAPNLDIAVKDEQFMTAIHKIKRQKNISSFLPPQIKNQKVLVLDLDETLIHTTFLKPKVYDFQSIVNYNDLPTKIYIAKRFGLDAFLYQMSKLYELIIFTASQKSYADHVIDLIDPKEIISHRLYRQNCVKINKTYILKNIRILGRKQSDIIIVDDNNLSGLLQPQNFYKIEPFRGNCQDRQLFRLSSFLKYAHKKKQLHFIKQLRKQFEEMQIDLQQQNASSKSIKSQSRNLIQKQAEFKHFKKNSQLQTLNNSVQDRSVPEFQTTGSQMIKQNN